MIDHVSLGSHRYADAVAFYRRTLAPLGLELQRDTGAEAGYGTAAAWPFFLYPVPPDQPVTARGTHVAFGAASRSAVDAVHAAAIGAGGESVSTPRLRPDIGATYYGAMFLDLDGHRVEVLTHAVG